MTVHVCFLFLFFFVFFFNFTNIYFFYIRLYCNTFFFYFSYLFHWNFHSCKRKSGLSFLYWVITSFPSLLIVNKKKKNCSFGAKLSTLPSDFRCTNLFWFALLSSLWLCIILFCSRSFALLSYLWLGIILFCSRSFALLSLIIMCLRLCSFIAFGAY